MEGCASDESSSHVHHERMRAYAHAYARAYMRAYMRADMRARARTHARRVQLLTSDRC